MGAPVPVDELRRVGVDAGLDAFGVAPVEPFRSTRRHLEERKEAGLHGGMAFTYRNPARSTEPARLLAGARSLVVGARHYDRLAPGPDAAAGPAGRVARYVWEDHYAALREALGAVGERLAGAGWRYVISVDGNGLVDREAAYRAGLGWYGKNTTILLPDRGSWFVLGALVTDAPLPSAEGPVEDGCGPCRRCLDGCPTGALTEPGVLDARRCLAWLVQADGVFPPEHRVALGDRIYGCDDCQEVCPPSRRAASRARGRAEVAVAIGRGGVVSGEAWVPLLEILDGSDTTLLERWGRWYIPRRDPRYLRRNALVALGNVGSVGDPRVVSALERYVGHPDPLLRAHAVWAARRLGRPDLAGRLRGDPDPLVAAELDRAVEVRAG